VEVIINNPLILGDTSPVSPSIAFCNGNLYLAWKGDGNDDLNVMVSTDAGVSFSDFNKFYSPAETSSDAPALAADGSTLFIAWKEGNDHLHVSTVALDPVSGRPLGINSTNPLTDTSPFRPALAVLNGKVYLAWRGDGNDDLNVMMSTDAGPTGASFSDVNKLSTSAQTSSAAPTLGTNDGSLFIAWRDGNDYLNVASVLLDLLSGRPLAINPPAVLGDTSQLNPALAGLNGNLYLAWKGDGNDNLNVKVSTNGEASFGSLPFTSAQTSSDAPALASDGSTLFIAWKGDSNDKLNVARVMTISVFIGRSEFTVTGSGWDPGHAVQVISNYDNGTDFPGRGGPYLVAPDGTFSGTIPAIPDSYFSTEGTLFVEATDTHSGQSVSEYVPHLDG
jgi:hypothetical protein